MAGDDERPKSKVARLIAEYGLGGLGDELERAWLGESGARTSLRDLADRFNRALLRSALASAGRTASDVDVESTYRVLTDGDQSNADRIRKERELAREGVDVDSLRTDFVTHQAVHTYLTAYRGVELDGETPDPAEKIETLQRLEGRTSAVAESTLSALIDADEVVRREYNVFVDVRAVCEDCASGYSLVELIETGGCTCDREDET